MQKGQKMDLMGMLPEEIGVLCKAASQPLYRAGQIFSFLTDGIAPADMSNLPKAFRAYLEENTVFRLPKVEEKYVSAIDGTVKYLFKLIDGECIESVLMSYEHGHTLCISSQVGCPMGCRFCASTIGGKVRDLYPSEMLGQIIAAGKDAGVRIDNVVMMGIGEPLDNYDNVIRFLQLVNHEEGLNIGYRHISLSTCGVVPGIDKLAKENLPITLSISLHAATDAARSAVMPVNKKWNIEKLMDACVRYYKTTGRRISFEYTLLAGQNDSEADAEALASLLKKSFAGTGAPLHVNLIRVNEVEETAFSRGTTEAAKKFAAKLCAKGVNATVRRRLGSDINAACGQLRRQNQAKTNRINRMPTYGMTDPGMCRPENQDCYAVCRVRGQTPRLLGVVCDGMGGVHGGETASRMATEMFVEQISETEWGAPEGALEAAFAAANTAVYRKAVDDPALEGMGTTVAAVLVDEEQGTILHVGDSRVYLWHDGVIRQLTRDHSYVQELLDHGRITPQEAEHHPKKNLITRALGVKESMPCEIGRFVWQTGDRLLLCSDGLSNFVTDEDLAVMLTEHTDLRDAAHEMVAAANCAGGEDNITVLLIENKEGDNT